MGRSAVLALKITGDASGGAKALEDTHNKLGAFGSSLGKIAGLAGGAFAVGEVIDFGKAAFDAASNLEQMSGSVDAVFGDAAASIHDFASEADKAVGLSMADYDQMASLIGSQLKNAGVPMDQLAGKTQDLIKQGADMSAVFGGSAADAVEALSSVMKGEFDPIEKYGVSLNQTAINAELARRHQDKLTGAALRQAQVQAALDLVTKQTAATQGQFAAQGDTAAEKSQKLAAWFDNLKANIGGFLLPIFGKLVDFFTSKVSPILETLFAQGGPLSGIFAQLGAIVSGQLLPAWQNLWNTLAPKVLPVLQDLGNFVTKIVMPALSAVYSFLSSYVVPIMGKILAPVLQGIHDLFKKVTDKLVEHRATFQKLWDTVKPFFEFLRDKVAPFLGGVFKTAFDVVGTAIGAVVDAISWVVEKVKWLLDKGGQFLKWIGIGSSGGGAGSTRGAGLFGATAAGGVRLMGAGSLGGGGVGPTAAAQGITPATVVNITVQGALDPVAVADQIRRILDARGVRLGGSPALAVSYR